MAYLGNESEHQVILILDKWPSSHFESLPPSLRKIFLETLLLLGPRKDVGRVLKRKEPASERNRTAVLQSIMTELTRVIVTALQLCYE
jgi:hypothetical protein